MDLSEIGAAFREARLLSGRSQIELARSLGMSRATLSALENGRCQEIGVARLRALVQSVGLDVFVAPQREPPAPEEPPEELGQERQRR